MNPMFFYLFGLAYFLSFTAPTMAQMELEVGAGQVRLIDSEWPLTEEKRRELETNLMVDPTLKEWVNASETKVFSLQERVIHSLDEKIDEGLLQLQQELKIQVQEKLERGEYVVQDGASGASSNSSLEFSGTRVVMGSSEMIRADQKLKEVVVIGGRVEVFGKVESLVVIGGHATLQPGAEVTKELVIVGGYVEEDPASRVQGKRVDLSTPGGDEVWTILREKLRTQYLKDLTDQTWLKVLGLLIKILVLMGCFGMGQFFAPAFQEKVRNQLRSGFLRSASSGLISILLVLPMTLFLTLSIVGIPLLPLQFSLLFLFIIYGELHIGHWLTSWIPQLQGQLFWGTLLGVVSLEVLGVFLGLGWLKWLMILVGFGATSRVFYAQIFSRNRN